jgi:hypothetical protein
MDQIKGTIEGRRLTRRVLCVVLTLSLACDTLYAVWYHGSRAAAHRL